jgi:hypothetical protein
MPRCIAMTLLVVLLPSLPLFAQDVSPPAGSRVRVRGPCGTAAAPLSCTTVIGRLVTPMDDSLLLEDEQGVRHPIDLAAGARLERSAGYRRHTLLGLGLGSLVGFGAGAVLASGCTQGGRGEDDGLCNLYYLVTVPVGAGVGTLVGALTRTERWAVVSGSETTLRMGRATGRTTVAVTVPF